MVIEASKKDRLLEHTNSMDPHIRFTVEETGANGAFSFFDTLVMPEPDNSLKTTLHRKSTYTDLYLQWDSHNNLAANVNVINTLTYRAKTVCSGPQVLKREEEHLKQALQRFRYPLWALKRANIKHNKPNRPTVYFINIRNNQSHNNNKMPHIVVPYNKGLGEYCKNICSKHGIQMYFRGGRTIRDFLEIPRTDIPSIFQKSGVICRYM